MSGSAIHTCWEVCIHLLIRRAGRKGTGRGREMSAKPTWWVGQPDMKKAVCSSWFQLWDRGGGGKVQVWGEDLALSPGALQVNRAVKNTQKETAKRFLKGSLRHAWELQDQAWGRQQLGFGRTQACGQPPASCRTLQMRWLREVILSSQSPPPPCASEPHRYSSMQAAERLIHRWRAAS